MAADHPHNFAVKASLIAGLSRQVRPDLPVTIRTQDGSDIKVLKASGATKVVAEIIYWSDFKRLARHLQISNQ